MWLIKVLLVGLLVFFLVPGVEAQDWWDSDYILRSQINITNNNDSIALISNFTLNLTFDHMTLVDNNVALPNGTDFRITIDHNREIDRVLCKGSSWNVVNTCIEFRLTGQLAASASNISYFAYFNNPVPAEPLQNASNVYAIYDDFGDDITKANWTNVSSGGCDIDITDNKMVIDGGVASDDCRMFVNLGRNLTGFKVEAGLQVDWNIDHSHKMLIFAMSSEDNFGWDTMNNFSGIRKWAIVDGFQLLDSLDAGGTITSNEFLASDNSTYNITFHSIGTDRFVEAVNDSYTNSSGKTAAVNNGLMQYFYLFTSQDAGGGSLNFFNFTDIRLKDYIEPQPTVTLGSAQSSTIDDCSVFNVSVLNFTLFNEENDSVRVFSDMEATFIITNQLGITSNVSFEILNQTSFAFCSDSNATIGVNATIRYTSANGSVINSSTRFYFFQDVVLDNVTDHISLYLLSESLSAQITFILVDPYNLPLADRIVKITRFFIGDGDYTQVSMGLSDFDGEATTQMKLNEWYIFIVEFNGEIIRIFPQKFVIDTADITLNTQPGTQVEYFEYYDSLGASCSENQAASLLTCIFSDTSGKMVELNLTVTRQQLVGGFITVCTNTTTASSGTISCSYAGYNTTDLVYTLRGRFCCSETTFFNLLTGMIIGVTAAPFGVIGVIAMIFILMASILFGYWNPVIPIVMGLFGIMIGMMLQLIVVSGISFMSLVIAGGILIWKMRT